MPDPSSADQLTADQLTADKLRGSLRRSTHNPEDPVPLSRNRRFLFLAGVPAAAIAVWWAAAPVEQGPHPLLKTYLLAWLAVVSVWLVRLMLRRFLWRVSRRLAFSYFLLGVLPIPLVALVMAVGLYVLAGFFLGHLHRDAAAEMQIDLQYAARAELDHVLLGHQGHRGDPRIDARFAYYKDGRRIAGDRDLPAHWRPYWPQAGSGPGMLSTTFFADRSGTPTLVGAARSGRLGVLAVFDGNLSAELSTRSGIWTEIIRSDHPSRGERTSLNLFGRSYPIEALRPEATEQEILAFQDLDQESPSWLDRPWVVWLELNRSFIKMDTGGAATEYAAATLATSLTGLWDELVSGSVEVGFWVYLVFAGAVLITLNLYILATIMALTLILSLSRAVNRLTDATQRLQKQDFSTRIEVMRDDQIGALQKSFNIMAENLETSVADAAQKEIFERELEIARQMQHGLLPDTLKAPAPLSFATFFQPSRAIGGDYYDLLTLADGRHAMVVADVSGHGLPAGLRMAMVKSAFELLCEQSADPPEILSRLHGLLLARLQQRNQRRAFVTATLAAIDREKGEIELVNAGHTPTYRLRGGEVLEIVLPGPPLGTLKPCFTSHRFDAQAGDIWVWLSDGIIEACNAEGELFGFEKVVDVIRACSEREPCDAAAVKRALLAAVAEHQGAVAIDDDLTLVVMGWGSGGVDGSAAATGPAATGPAATGPTATGPAATGPAATGPEPATPTDDG